MPDLSPPAASAECLWRKEPSSRALDCQMISVPGQMTPWAPATSPCQAPPVFAHASPDLGPAPSHLALPTQGAQLRPHAWKPTRSVPASPNTSLSWARLLHVYKTFSPFFFFLYQFSSHCTC